MIAHSKVSTAWRPTTQNSLGIVDTIYGAWLVQNQDMCNVHQFQIFRDNTIDHENVEKSVGNSGLVVIELSKTLPKGTPIFFDNYLASPLLAYRLKKKDYDSTMTFTGNRKTGTDKHVTSQANHASLIGIQKLLAMLFLSLNSYLLKVHILTW